MPSESSLPLKRLLQDQLANARLYDADILARNQEGGIIQVPGIGQNISSAYEQLRNAAESAEEHLLLQRAIRRFYNRSLSFASGKRTNGVGEELVLELTHAGYLANNSIGGHTAAAISRLAQKYVIIYQQLGKQRLPRDQRLNWVLDILSVETETLLNPNHRRSAIAFVAYQHYLKLFPRQKLAATSGEKAEYELCLYIAVHQALLKSDAAVVRYDLLRIHRQTPDDLAAFITFNRAIDKAYTGRLTQKLKRAVNRYGAPFRIVYALSEERIDLPELLADRQSFLETYDRQVAKEYKSVTKRLNKGIAKSIVFIFITKVSVGLAIEIPYDLLVLDHVAVLPLAVNLLFPPLYMASFRLGLRAPTEANAEALRTYVDQIFYGKDRPVQTVRVGTRPISAGAKFAYTILFFIPLALMVYALMKLEFNIVQGIIFFVFLSTASFLGFRLLRMARELELLVKPPSFGGAVRDFFYLPFIVMGQWISSKYTRLNIVAYILDVLVELPLKTVLRLVRQWTRFLSDKHDEIY